MFKIKNILMSMVLVLVLANGLYSAEVLANMDSLHRASMKKNIRIMEDILANLFDIENQNSVQGVYIENYGLIFNIFELDFYSTSGLLKFQQAHNDFVVHNKALKRKLSVKIGESEEEREELKKIINQRIEEIQKNLKEFFLDYASSLRGLSKDERICININFEKDPFLPLYQENLSEGMIPLRMIALSKAEDLKAYRTGRLDETDIAKRINFKNIFDRDEDREIRIMSNVMDAILEDYSPRHDYAFGEETQGMYLEDFGVLFFITGNLRSSSTFHFSFETDRLNEELKNLKENLAEMKEKERELKDKAKRLKDIVIERDDESGDTEKVVIVPPLPEKLPIPPVWSFSYTDDENDSLYKENIRRLKEDLIDAIGTYGHTLDNVKSGEFILVAVKLRSGMFSDKGENMYIKISKSDIDRFTREKLSEEDFRKRAEVWIEPK